MGRKFYLHPGAELHEGRWICNYCGRELPVDERGMPVTQVPFPCTTSPPIPFDSEIEISVWNCQATVLINKKPIDYDMLPKRQAQKLERLAVESVERAGGAINWSGIYPPSEKLCQYIDWLKKQGYI